MLSITFLSEEKSHRDASGLKGASNGVGRMPSSNEPEIVRKMRGCHSPRLQNLMPFHKHRKTDSPSYGGQGAMTECPDEVEDFEAIADLHRECLWLSEGAFSYKCTMK